MDRDIHTDALIYRTTVLSEGLKLSEDTVEHDNEVNRRCEEAERYLLTVTVRRSYEDRI